MESTTISSALCQREGRLASRSDATHAMPASTAITARVPSTGAVIGIGPSWKTMGATSGESVIGAASACRRGPA